MKKNTYKIAVLFAFISWQVHASDPVNGQIIAVKYCDRCHGEFGISDDTDTPHLASQSINYILKQLKDYKSKARKDKNMYKRAKKLSEQQMLDVATWYETQLLPETNPALRENIKTPVLINKGNVSRGIPACDLCHGKDGKTSIGSTPALAGQQFGYLLSTMGYFADGSRDNDPGGAVQGIIKKLSDVEMEAIAVYYSELGGREAEE
ncbi:Cytochrome c4 [uncultured Candidatus Thioglobus sp.]|nr:Cytochrome c4 [uncultured Candidatus Thioglobus sp.]